MSRENKAEFIGNDSMPEKLENLEIRPADCIIFFGRGIEKVSLRAEQGDRTEKWKPTRLIQEVVKQPGQDRHIRTGSRKSGEPLIEFSEGDDVKEMIGGGTANVIAAAELYKRLYSQGQPPKEIIISGGRPGYLDKEDPELTEAKIMREAFLTKVKADESKAPVPENITISETSKNTEDDLSDSLRIALSRNYSSAVIVSADTALERLQAFYEYTVLPKNPDFSKLRVQFVSANDLLSLRMGERFKKIENELEQTAAYEDTKKNEAIGTAKAKKNQYGKGGQY